MALIPSQTAKFTMMDMFAFMLFTKASLKWTLIANLLLNDMALFQGELYCHELEVHGHFKGLCRSSGRIIIYPGANVSGEIHAESIIIYPGAQVNIEGHTAQTIN